MVQVVDNLHRSDSHIPVTSVLVLLLMFTTPQGRQHCDGKMRLAFMYNYWLVCREMCAKLCRYHSSSDGLRVGGDETIPHIFYTPQNKKMSSGPPQVPDPKIHGSFLRSGERAGGV